MSKARFGNYELVAPLPPGGMAEIHVARKENSAIFCVLKTLKLSLMDNDIAAKRLQREARLAAYLRHPNIASILDAGVHEGVFYLASEFVPGLELAAILDAVAERQRFLPIEVVLRIATDVLDGLEYAHDALDPDGQPLGFVHRDLTPRNVLIRFDGITKIIDFGAAKASLGDFATLPGMMVGTPRYSTPEAVAAEPLDRRADIYTVGVLLFEMFTTRHLIATGSLVDMLSAVVQQEAPPLSAFRPDLPPALDAVVAKALRKNRKERWPNAATFRAALQEAAGTIEAADSDTVGRTVRALFPERWEKYAELDRRLAQHRAKVMRSLHATMDDMPAIEVKRAVRPRVDSTSTG